MTGIVRIEQPVERIERFHSLQGGQYWRANEAIAEENIAASEVLLIESLRWVDNKLHTVILRTHPSKHGQHIRFEYTDESGRTCGTTRSFTQHRFLFDDFVNKFTFAADSKEVRESEVQACQQLAQKLTVELSEAMTNPERMKEIIAERLEKEQTEKSENKLNTLPATIDQYTNLATGPLENALTSGVNEESIKGMMEAARHGHKLAVIQSEWLQGKNNEITRAVQAVVPYYQEMAAAQLAAFEESRENVESLMKGIASLDLFIGKDVVVNTIIKGNSAPSDIPLTFVQKKLLMDEELAVYLDLGDWFDFTKADLFDQALQKHPGLIEQIFPTQRCVLVMAVTRRHVNYQDPWEAAAKDFQNRCVFLLVRDGENIYQVCSPVESHLGAHTLFPERDEQDALFRGFDGSRITFRDVAYTDRLRAHEKMALHYKRFLILCCGLDQRERLFGEFYDRSSNINFISMDFQEKYCRFIHDADGTGLLSDQEADTRPSLESYIKQANQHLRSGSRVFCEWRQVVNPVTAPGAAKDDSGNGYRGHSFTVDFVKSRSTSVAYQKNEEIYVDVPVVQHTYSRNAKSDKREFNAKVCLSKFRTSDSLGYLCLDTVKSADLEYYIHNRRIRANHLYYIRLFKELAALLKLEETHEEQYRSKMLAALNAGNIGDENDRVAAVDKTIQTWRCANRGASLQSGLEDEKQWKALLAMMDLIAWRGHASIPQIECYCEQLGNSPLRLVVMPNGKLGLYVAPRAEERNDAAEKHKWAIRVVLSLTRTGVKEVSRSWALVNELSVSECTLKEWPLVDEWKGLKSVFESYDRKLKALADIELGRETLKRLNPSNQEGLSELAELWINAFEEMNFYRPTGGIVQKPVMMIPIGLIVDREEWSYLYLGTRGSAVEYIYQNLNDKALKARVAHRLISNYEVKEGKLDNLANKKTSLGLFCTKQRPDMAPFSADRNIETYGPDFGVNHAVLTHMVSFKSQIALIQQEADRGLHRRFTIASNLVSSAGELLIDQLLGDAARDADEPVDILEVVINPAPTGEPGAKLKKNGETFWHKHWCDLCKPGTEESLALSHIHAPDHVITRTSFSSKEDAILFVLKTMPQARKYEKDFFRDNDFDVPDGIIERWIDR